MTTGFQIQNQQLYVDKDPTAKLTYTFDWSEWLQASDYITACTYTLQIRANDPIPLVKQTSGFTGTATYVSLSGGQTDKIYTVYAQITTHSGLIDRRNFKIKIVNRSA